MSTPRIVQCKSASNLHFPSAAIELRISEVDDEAPTKRSNQPLEYMPARAFHTEKLSPFEE